MTPLIMKVFVKPYGVYGSHVMLIHVFLLIKIYALGILTPFKNGMRFIPILSNIKYVY